jgi:hypothetical protein
MTDVKDVVTMVAESRKHFEDCILCKSPTKQRGIWEPGKAGTMGAKQDKRRYFIYALCDKHALNADTAVMVENTIMSMMRLS